jgi:tripartite-type tricarboxylate transporter receptor subunit TctC
MRILGIFLALALCGSASAQAPGAFPSKPVRIVVGFAPGGGTDFVARLLAAQLADRWKSSVIVENRAGATGIIGMESVAKSPPDGHTVLLGSNGDIINVALKKTQVDIRKAFVPAVPVTKQAYVLVATASLPVSSVKELVALAKSKPGALSHGTSGNGSIAHLGMELFNLMTGVRIEHIPYKGGGPARADLLAGRTQVLLGPVGSVISDVRAGKLKFLAISSEERLPSLPDLPTIAESGAAGYELSNIYGLWAPAGSPESAISAINRDAIQALKAPEFAAKLSAQGVDAAPPVTPAQYRAAMEREFQKWEKLFATPGLDVESFK